MANLIEQNVRISKSKLWDLQSQFYKKYGIEFWRERASFTSANTVVVSACVDLLIGYLKDQKAHFDRREPIYFVELGTGSGCFAFRFLKEFLLRVSSNAEISDLNVRYVMTDFIPEIVSIWRSNPFLRSFVDSGSLDFAAFDPSCDQAILTSCFGWSLDSGSLINAPVFVANALFDTIAVDGFRFSNGSATEVFISVEANPHDPMSSIIDNTLVVEQHAGNLVEVPYYENPHFDEVLRVYSTDLRQGVLSIPIKAMEILDNLSNLSRHRVALLCCSRGFSDLRYAELSDRLQYQDLSFPLNFDALRKYFATTGGELLLPIKPTGEFISRCLSFGFYPSENDAAGMQHVREQYQASSSQLARVTESVQQKMKEAFSTSGGDKSAIESAVDVVAAGCFDPPLFLKCIAQLMDSIETELQNSSRHDQKNVEKLIDMLRKVDSNIYTFDRAIPAPVGDDDVLALLIRVWQRASAAHHQPTGRTFFDADD